MEIAKPVRRIVTAQDENEKPMVLFDGPTPDVRTDPARPGYASAQIWATDRTPARIKGVKETLPLSRIIEPPKNGSVFRVVTFPRMHLTFTGRTQGDPGILQVNGLSRCLDLCRRCAASLPAKDYNPRFLYHPGGQYHTHSGHRGGSPDKRRHCGTTRHQSCVEQPF